MNPGPASETTQRVLRNWMRGLALLLLSGLSLTLCFPGFNLWWLAFVALAPWVICIIRRPMNWRWMGTYYLFGVGWFAINLYWLYPITWEGVTALCFLMGVYWLLFAWGTRRLIVELRWPALVAVPVVWVAAEYLRSTFLSGFQWYLLGNALVAKPVLIQNADLWGVWGVSFLAAMCSGWLVDLLRLPLWVERKAVAGTEASAPTTPAKVFNPFIGWLTASLFSVMAAAVIYGGYRLSEQTTRPGPRVAVVQEVIPQSQKDNRDAAAKQDLFNKHLELSRQAVAKEMQAGSKIDLVVWPETMVPEPINRELLEMSPAGLSSEGKELLGQIKNYDRTLTTFSRQAGVHLLVGAPSLIPKNDRKNERQNVAVMYSPTTGQVWPYYAKRHLVPFGEYVPFRETLPWLNGFLLSLTPYGGYDYSLRPGTEWRRFELPAGDGQTYHFGTPICYEDVMPYPCQRIVSPQEGRKQADFLVSISNDGWYNSRDELDQHLHMSQMRAVENRVPVARSVNTGNSGFINSNGQVIRLVGQDEQGRGETHFKPGFAITTLPIDSRVSLYSRIGDLFPAICGMLAALAVGWSVVHPRRGGGKE